MAERSAVIVRHATPADAAEVAGLVARAFDAAVLPGWSPSAIARFREENTVGELGRILAEAASAHVAIGAGRLLAVGIAKRPDTISLVVVDRDRRRSGIGSTLIDRILADIDAMPAATSSVEINATEASAAFYRRKGFYPISDWIDLDGCRFVRMAYWRLSPLRHRSRA